MTRSSSLICASVAASVSIACVVIYHSVLKNLIVQERRTKYLYQVLKKFQKEYNQVTDDYKRRLFQPLIYMDSKILRLKKALTIRILEIGTGSGINLPYYPPNCRLIAVEANPYFEATFHESLQKAPGVTLEKYINGQPENLMEIEAGSVDVVVCTLSLCSASDVNKVLHEIHRVLVPGGKFLYMEHVRDKPGTWLYYKQRFCTVTRIWPFFYGCSVDRDIDKEILQSKLFPKVEQQRIYFSSDGFRLISPHVVGTATKDD